MVCRTVSQARPFCRASLLQRSHGPRFFCHVRMKSRTHPEVPDAFLAAGPTAKRGPEALYFIVIDGAPMRLCSGFMPNSADRRILT